MNFKSVNPRSPFTFEDLDMDLEEFDHAMSEMIRSGLIISFVEDGQVYYQLTDMGYTVGQHLTESSKMVN